jgi:K+-sensing histidine kinase KdpD
MLRWITLARSWHALVRIGLAAIAVAATTALQMPIEANVPGKPFMPYLVAVVASAAVLGRTPGFLAVIGSSLASLLFFEPIYSFSVTHAVDLLSIEMFAVGAALSVEVFCRLVDSALAEKS